MIRILPLLALFLVASAACAEDADLGKLRARLVENALPRQPDDLAGARQTAERYLRNIRTDGSWPDIRYTDQGRAFWDTSRHLDRLLAIAQAYAAPGQPLKGDPRLKAALLRGLIWWETHDYRNPNWWWNEIGVPMKIGQIMLLAGADLPAPLREKGVEIMKRCVWHPGQGENTVWMANITIQRGILQGSPVVAADGFRGVYGEIRVVDQPGQEGIMPDWSFHQHGDQLYSGGYGYGFGCDTAENVALGWGTRFQIPAGAMAVLTSYLLDGQNWIQRGWYVDFSTIGREITRSHGARPKSLGPVIPHGAGYGLVNAAEVLARLPVPRRAEFAGMARRLRGEAPDFRGNRHFWWSDYMSHHRPAWFASVKMLSRRMQAAEIVNGEGKRSHCLSDGATFIYRTGDEYRNIFPVWDWEHVPGTTVQTGMGFDPAKVARRGTTAFVGGASDGTYGLAAMDLERDGLSARKAWFFFDDEFVCLGAGITCTADHDVITTVNQCLLRGPVRNNAGLSPAPAARGLLHDGVGYFFPGRADVRLKAGEQTGRWSDIGAQSDTPVTEKVFHLWIDHGPGPAGASYAYIVAPGMDGKGFEKASRALPVAILSNTKSIQAVHHPKLGILQAAFWSPGTLQGGGWVVTVDKPCLLMLRVMGKALEVASSNPENTPLTVHCTVNRDLTGRDTAPAPGGTALTLELPKGDRAGSTLVRTFALKGTSR